MSPRHIATLLAFQLAIVLTLTACGDKTVRDDGSLFVEPCIPLEGSEVDPCLRDPYWEMPSQIHADYTSDAFLTSPIDLFDQIERFAEHSYDNEGVYTPQFYVRGTFVPGSARCLKSAPWSNAGYSFVSFDCFVDLRVNEYFNGDGPGTIPIFVYWGSALENELTDTHQLFKGGWPGTAVEGKEMVVALVRPIRTSDTVWGAWSWVKNASWDVQRREDSKVVVVSLWTGVFHPADPSEWEYTLEEFRPLVKDAMARFRADTGGRVGYHPDDPEFARDASGASLIQHLRNLKEFSEYRVTPAPAPMVPGETDPDPYGYRADEDTTTASAEDATPTDTPVPETHGPDRQ